MLASVLIDTREPSWVHDLAFGGVPKTATALPYGDIWAACDDGCVLVIERKTPSDLLNTLAEHRLFPQVAQMVQQRIDSQLGGRITHWPYLLITDDIRHEKGKAVVRNTKGEWYTTGWDYSSVWGALLEVQDMGCEVLFCAGQEAFEQAVITLSRRKRNPDPKVLPPRPPDMLGKDAEILASLGVGPDKVERVLDAFGGSVAWALDVFTDPDFDLDGILPDIPSATKKRIRTVMRKYLNPGDGNRLAVVGPNLKEVRDGQYAESVSRP